MLCVCVLCVFYLCYFDVAIHSVYQILVPVSTKSLLLSALYITVFSLITVLVILVCQYICVYVFFYVFFCAVILTELSMFCVRLSHFIIKFD